MPNKRSKRKSQQFYCPYCQNRLWRPGFNKYCLFYQGKEEIQKGFQLTSKKAALVAQQQTVIVDRQVWLEDFLCENDGKIWLCLSNKEEGKNISYRLATEQDWEHTSHTPDPNRPNCSVSEFTYRMSRRPLFTDNKRIYE